MDGVNVRQQINRVVGLILLSLMLVAGCIMPPIKAPATTASTQAEATTTGELYTDPAGRFLAPVPTNWTVTAGEGDVSLRDPEGAIRVYLLTLDAADPQVVFKYGRYACLAGSIPGTRRAHAVTESPTSASRG